MENEKDLDEGGIERISGVMRILAEAKAKADLLAEEAMKDYATQEATLTGFEKNNSFVETKAIEKGGSKAIEWLIPVSKTVEEAKAFGENYRKIIERIIEVSRRALGMAEFFRKKEANQGTAGQAGDKGGDWMKDPLLKMFMTKPERPLAESPEVDYAVSNGWSRVAGPLVQETEEVPGLAGLFLPKRLPLRNKNIVSQSLFDPGRIQQSLKIWQPWLSKEGPLPLKEFQKLQEEKLIETSEIDEVTPQLRSRIYGNLFQISTRRGEYDRARDSIGKSMYEAAEAAKGAKKEDKDALLAEVMKTKANTEEIKDMIRRIKDKDSKPTPRERGAARSDPTKSSGASDWTEDELLEEVMKGLLPR